MYRFSDLWTHIVWRFLRFRYLLSSSPISRTIDGVTAVFAISSFREFLRAVDYHDEAPLVERLLEAAQPDDVFWDVGANTGTHSCFVGQRVSSVIALEPHPGNAERARENLELNRVTATVIEYALGDQAGYTKLRLPRGDTDEVGLGTFTLRQTSESTEIESVKIVSGDSLLYEQGLSPPDILKIDVEGSELEVLRGFREGVSNARVVAVEVHPEFADVDSVTEFLETVGFDIEILRRRNDEIQLLARS